MKALKIKTIKIRQSAHLSVWGKFQPHKLAEHKRRESRATHVLQEQRGGKPWMAALTPKKVITLDYKSFGWSMFRLFTFETHQTYHHQSSSKQLSNQSVNNATLTPMSRLLMSSILNSYLRDFLVWSASGTRWSPTGSASFKREAVHYTGLKAAAFSIPKLEESQESVISRCTAFETCWQRLSTSADVSFDLAKAQFSALLLARFFCGWYTTIPVQILLLKNAAIAGCTVEGWPWHFWASGLICLRQPAWWKPQFLD